MITRWRPLSVLLLAAMMQMPQASTAAILADSAIAHLGGANWTALARSQLLQTACAPGAPPALVLSVDPPSRREIATCEATGKSVALAQPIGWEAVYLVAREADWVGLGSRELELYLALAASVPTADGNGFVANRVRNWREVAPRLPDAPIRVLMPSADRPPYALFMRTVMESGCLQAPAARAIFGTAERVGRCTALRTDGAVDTAAPGGDPWDWLDAQPPYAIAVVTAAEIATLDDRFVVVPVAGVIPTYSAVVSGDYPASWQVILTVTDAEGLPSVLAAAGDLVSESMVGPGGRMADSGLTPLSANQRVALRARLLPASVR